MSLIIPPRINEDYLARAYRFARNAIDRIYEGNTYAAAHINEILSDLVMARSAHGAMNPDEDNLQPLGLDKRPDDGVA